MKASSRSARSGRSHAVLRPLRLSDMPLVRRFMAGRRHGLSVSSFAVLALSRALYTVSWAVIDGCLCVFCRDRLGCFLLLPPQGKGPGRRAIERSFAIMDRYNRNPAVSRIENVEKDACAFFERLGYCCRHAFDEYVYNRSELARLPGDRFKSKRASVNHFLSHNIPSYEPFNRRDIKECRALHAEWRTQRAATSDDRVYQGLLDDNAAMLEAVFADAARLGIIGRVVRVAGRIKAFSFGTQLDPSTFCILFEVADHAVKGISQYIFRQFCQELDSYQRINCMDDAGFARLARVKHSYRPQELVASYTVTRPDA